MISWVVAIIVLFALGHHHAVANLLLLEVPLTYFACQIKPELMPQRTLWGTIVVVLLLSLLAYNV